MNNKKYEYQEIKGLKKKLKQNRKRSVLQENLWSGPNIQVLI